MSEQVKIAVPPKPALDSLTIQGLLVVALGLLTRWLGLEMDEAALGQAVGDAWSLLGLGMAAWGRARATGPLVWRASPQDTRQG
jgi:hypothetical protein